MRLHLLKLTDTRMKQVYAKHELQDKHSNRVDIGVTISLKYRVRDAYHLIAALWTLLDRQVLQLHSELVSLERVNLAKVYVFSLSRCLDSGQVLSTHSTTNIFVVAVAILIIICLVCRSGRLWTYLANLNLEEQSFDAQVPDGKACGVQISQSLE